MASTQNISVSPFPPARRSGWPRCRLGPASRSTSSSRLEANEFEVFRGKENDMRIGSVSHSSLMLIAGGTVSLTLVAGSARATPRAQADLVEFEKMTWVEVKAALAAGQTTALIYTGGTE